MPSYQDSLEALSWREVRMKRKKQTVKEEARELVNRLLGLNYCQGPVSAVGVEIVLAYRDKVRREATRRAKYYWYGRGIADGLNRGRDQERTRARKAHAVRD